MRFVPWVVAAVAVAAFAVVTVFHFASPRVETVTKLEPLPARPSKAQFKKAMENVEVIESSYQLVLGYPMSCSYADSTFHPDTSEDLQWVAQWCYRVSQREAIQGGLVG